MDWIGLAVAWAVVSDVVTVAIVWRAARRYRRL